MTVTTHRIDRSDDRRVINWLGTCVELRADDLHAYDDSSRTIASHTFRALITADAWHEAERMLGYRDDDLKLYDRSLTLHTDFAVRFSRGRWHGHDAVCIHWSGIHHLWFLGERGSWRNGADR